MKVIWQRAFFLLACLFLVACGTTNEGTQPTPGDEDSTSGQQLELNNQDNQDEDAEAEDETDEKDDAAGEADIPADEKVVVENEAFKVFQPSPNEEYTDEIVVRGLTRVFEGTVQYEFEDGHFILDKGFTTASEGAPAWGEFSFTIELDEAIEGVHQVILFEESAKDGSRMHELVFPVHVKK